MKSKTRSARTIAPRPGMGPNKRDPIPHQVRPDVKWRVWSIRVRLVHTVSKQCGELLLFMLSGFWLSDKQKKGP